MTTLDPNSNYVVLINTFTVEPDNAEQLLSELSRATETGMRHRPGFISANLHLSTDKRHSPTTPNGAAKPTSTP